MKIFVIIPTFNERDNIGRMIDALQEQFSRIPHDMSILVVDDNSPDMTADVVRTAQDNYSNVYLSIGEKQGLGAAYIRGMTVALEEHRADAVFEMDADFSHNPEDLPRMTAALLEGADFVIGSRYVDGGSIPREWGLYRRLTSLVGNLVARYVAGIYNVRDCTAGFRVIRAALLRNIPFKDLRVQGYAFQVALLHEAKIRNARILEIPVDFIDRTAGTSKLGLRDIIEFIINAWWIRLRSSKTFIKFAIVGGAGVIVNLACFSGLLYLGMNQYVASPIAIQVSIISNFLFNNYWTFRWRKTKDRIRVKGLKFNIVSLIALLLSYSTFIVLTLLFPDTPPQIHQLIGVMPAMLVNYFLNSYWTFKHVG